MKKYSIEKTISASYFDFQWSEIAGKSVVSLHLYKKSDGDNQYYALAWSFKKSTGQIAGCSFDVSTGQKASLAGATVVIEAYCVDNP